MNQFLTESHQSASFQNQLEAHGLSDVYLGAFVGQTSTWQLDGKSQHIIDTIRQLPAKIAALADQYPDKPVEIAANQPFFALLRDLANGVSFPQMIAEAGLPSDRRLDVVSKHLRLYGKTGDVTDLYKLYVFSQERATRICLQGKLIDTRADNAQVPALLFQILSKSMLDFRQTIQQLEPDDQRIAKSNLLKYQRMAELLFLLNQPDQQTREYYLNLEKSDQHQYLSAFYRVLAEQATGWPAEVTDLLALEVPKNQRSHIHRDFTSRHQLNSISSPTTFFEDRNQLVKLVNAINSQAFLDLAQADLPWKQILLLHKKHCLRTVKLLGIVETDNQTEISIAVPEERRSNLGQFINQADVETVVSAIKDKHKPKINSLSGAIAWVLLQIDRYRFGLNDPTDLIDEIELFLIRINQDLGPDAIPQLESSLADDTLTQEAIWNWIKKKLTPQISQIYFNNDKFAS